MKENVQELSYSRPKWLPKSVVDEDFLCPDCFKVVGVMSRYRLVKILGAHPKGLSVSVLTKLLSLRQPTITHHLQILQSVDAVKVTEKGRERIYSLNRQAHCFEECHIPFS